MNRSYLRRNFWPLRESTDLHDVNLQFRLGECGASFALSGRSGVRCASLLLLRTIIEGWGTEDSRYYQPEREKASASKRFKRQQPANDIDRVPLINQRRTAGCSCSHVSTRPTGLPAPLSNDLSARCTMKADLASGPLRSPACRFSDLFFPCRDVVNLLLVRSGLGFNMNEKSRRPPRAPDLRPRTSSADGSGIASPSSTMPAICSARASAALRCASSSVLPAVMQPGKSGKLTPKSESLVHMQICDVVHGLTPFRHWITSP